MEGVLQDFLFLFLGGFGVVHLWVERLVWVSGCPCLGDCYKYCSVNQRL